MTAHESGKKRRPGERVYPEPKPRVELPKPSSECSTPELALGPSQGVKAILRRLDRKRESGADDDTPEAA